MASDEWPTDGDFEENTESDESLWETQPGEKAELKAPWPGDDEQSSPDPFEREEQPIQKDLGWANTDFDEEEEVADPFED